jgi:hypothetical protein
MMRRLSRELMLRLFEKVMKEAIEKVVLAIRG